MYTSSWTTIHGTIPDHRTPYTQEEFLWKPICSAVYSLDWISIDLETMRNEKNKIWNVFSVYPLVGYWIFDIQNEMIFRIVMDNEQGEKSATSSSSLLGVAIPSAQPVSRYFYHFDFNHNSFFPHFIFGFTIFVFVSISDISFRSTFRRQKEKNLMKKQTPVKTENCELRTHQFAAHIESLCWCR